MSARGGNPGQDGGPHRRFGELTDRGRCETTQRLQKLVRAARLLTLCASAPGTSGVASSPSTVAGLPACPLVCRTGSRGSEPQVAGLPQPFGGPDVVVGSQRVQSRQV